MYKINFEKEALLPRERLVVEGAEKLSNQELLAIILRTGNKKESVLNMANSILIKVKTIGAFKQLSLQELQNIFGIGHIRSIEIKAMIEFATRIKEAEIKKTDQLLSSEKLAKQMMLELGDKKQEELRAIYLDTQNRIIEQKTIFIGTVRRSIAEPREILHYACKAMATSLIVVHNHPSNSCYPSENDQRFTNKIKRSCEDLGIIFLDHIIVGQSNYYSFREEGVFF
ncbi:RadC family protein [Streptococcus marimammalium]|uniref:RadC family protein n=1 Tax=Streptococcus marimammalium TaxID=269666 RepID=UPI00038136D2|nr:DNA repair protein RadC [Streptococcus marimammalium]